MSSEVYQSCTHLLPYLQRFLSVFDHIRACFEVTICNNPVLCSSVRLQQSPTLSCDQAEIKS